MNKTIIFFIIMILFISLSSLVFTETIGVITYTEGEVVIARDEEELENIDTDMDIENYDVIRTGEEGTVELDVITALGQTISITVASNTAFSIEIDQYEKKETTTFEMLTGGLSLKVTSLMENENVEVQTESASMGVRGTSFEVTSEITGDLLVTCEEGKVVCIDDNGEEEVIEPGYVIEKNPNKKFMRNKVKREQLAAYRKEWRNKKRESFKKDGLPAFKRYAMKFDNLYKVLIRLGMELKKHKATLDQWARYAKNKKKPPRKQLMQDIKKIGPILVEMKKVMDVFERVVFQLQLMEPYHDKGHLKGDLKKGFKVKAFYKHMKSKMQDIKKMFRRVRHAVKLFIIMNNGHFPKPKARIKFDEDFKNYNPEF